MDAREDTDDLGGVGVPDEGNGADGLHGHVHERLDRAPAPPPVDLPCIQCRGEVGLGGGRGGDQVDQGRHVDDDEVVLRGVAHPGAGRLDHQPAVTEELGGVALGEDHHVPFRRPQGPGQGQQLGTDQLRLVLRRHRVPPYLRPV